MVENPHGGELNMVMFDTDEEDDSIREIFKNEDRDFLHPQTRSPRTPPPPLRVQFCKTKINPHFFFWKLNL